MAKRKLTAPQCPKGHKLPFRTETGECTPLYCAKVADVDMSTTALSTNVDKKDPYEEMLALAEARRNVRRRVAPAPDLRGEEAEAWATQKAVALLPKAVAELEYQLEFGNNTERREAARDVLDMNGVRKREQLNAGAATIILNIKATDLPWRSNEKVVAGEAQRGEKAALPSGGDDKP